MSIKEENEKLINENAQIVASINASKLALEDAKKQEAVGKSLLIDISKEIEATQKLLDAAKKDVAEITNEIKKVAADKANLELAISDAKKKADEYQEADKANYETELKRITTAIEVKQNELTELLNKIKTESFNLTTIKDEASTLDNELSKAQTVYDDVVARCKAKNGELNKITDDIASANKELNEAKQVLKDTVISTEAFDDHKTRLRNEIAELNDKVEATKETLTDINAEIAGLEAKKEIKEAEYKASESKIFELVRREEALGEREAYAKERFKVAGLEY